MKLYIWKTILNFLKNWGYVRLCLFLYVCSYDVYLFKEDLNLILSTLCQILLCLMLFECQKTDVLLRIFNDLLKD